MVLWRVGRVWRVVVGVGAADGVGAVRRGSEGVVRLAGLVELGTGREGPREWRGPRMAVFE